MWVPLVGVLVVTVSDDATERWRGAVAVLVTMPDAVARLRATHTADMHGRCIACTVPGRGTPGVTWPCALAALAADAEKATRGER